jgi:hypothetical protein
MVNRRFTARPRAMKARVISLLRPFFSDYSTNIKRFAVMLAELERRADVARRCVLEGLVSWTICCVSS